jgi:hypothetical protein
MTKVIGAAVNGPIEAGRNGSGAAYVFTRGTT